ncbi:MAG: type pilus assembly PilZ [Xanthobacteraceae bacterium]|jgi:23S rRNA-/tRNA-specific pseudouridylate synthase|nr:type pilus assembly PilZ [Xanthobacteraceae bacterium]
MSERRNTIRKKSFLQGRIYFNNRRSALDCLIRDISDTGAKLIFSDSVQTPDIIELYVPHKEQTLRAEVQWRRGEEMGVAFTDAEVLATDRPAGSATELAARVQKLEDEVASLRRLLKRMKAAVPGFDDADAA